MCRCMFVRGPTYIQPVGAESAVKHQPNRPLYLPVTTHLRFRYTSSLAMSTKARRHSRAWPVASSPTASSWRRFSTWTSTTGENSEQLLRTVLGCSTWTDAAGRYHLWLLRLWCFSVVEVHCRSAAIDTAHYTQGRIKALRGPRPKIFYTYIYTWEATVTTASLFSKHTRIHKTGNNPKHFFHSFCETDYSCAYNFF